mgnify:CR=1 FL=1
MTNKYAKEMQPINYLVTEIDAAFHEAARKLELTDSAMLVLYGLCDQGTPCPLNDIIRLSGLRKQTVNSALRKLEADGIVYLENLDRRKKRVCLTEQGKRLAEATVMQILQIEDEIFSAWTQAERDSYLELTRRYLTEFKAKTRDIRRLS